MKKSLLFLTLFALSVTLFSQTNTWTGATDTNWGTAANWSLNAVPTAANDVVIPTGKTVNLNVAGTTKSIVVQGNSTFNIYNNLSFLNASSFAANVTVNWSSSSLFGGGTLTNNGTVNLTTAGSRYIYGVTTVTNNGLFTMPGGGYLYLYDTSIFNNATNGIFDIQSAPVITYSGGLNHSFNNQGLLKKSVADGTAYVDCYMTNSGTISVESGTLNLRTLPKTFNSGIYNVENDNILSISTQINMSGTLTGALNGSLYWAGNVSVASTATFNFSGSTGVQWANSSLIGGGTLTNTGKLSLVTAGSRYISGDTTLNNTGTVTMPDGGYLYLYDTSIFNNATSGVFDIQSGPVITYSGALEHSFNNQGLLKQSSGDGGYIDCYFTNTGTISVQSGNLLMRTLTKTFNGGTYNVSADKFLSLDDQVNVSGTLTGALNGSLYWAGNISVASTATFNFSGSTGVQWANSSLIGGGTLTNASKLSLITGGSRYISGDTTFNNTGTVTMPDGGYLYLYDTSIFNNATSGVFDIQSGPVITYSGALEHNFNNQGLLKKSVADGTAYVDCYLTNSGTISVESGTLNMRTLPKTFNSGIYNVGADNILSTSTQINMSGTLTGALNGSLYWAGNISVASTATFNFSGSTGVQWANSSLIGGGTLTNASKLSLITGGSRYISGDTTLNNTGTVTMPDGGYLYLYDTSIFNNATNGIFDIQSAPVITYSGALNHSFNNQGLLKQSNGVGGYIDCYLSNSGTISVDSGTLRLRTLSKINTVDGIIKGTGSIGLTPPANFTNDGTFSPGGSPGTLTVVGDYKSSTTSGLDVELNGLVQGTDYDLLAITGTNVIFDGAVNVTLGFDAAVGNSFTIATVSGLITTKSLTTPTTAEFNGFLYSFNITYPNDKAVKLTITSRVDIQAPTVVTQNVTLQLNAAGNATLTAAQVNNGSNDNGTSNANLIYSLSKSNFNCSNLGANTVTLTVTDEAGNSATADATITVIDSIVPVITACLGDTSATGDTDFTIPNYYDTNQVTATDNCAVTTVVQVPSPGTIVGAGVTSVTVTVSDASGNEAVCSFNLDVALGINDYELSDSSIQLYPNPVRNVLTIKNVKNLELDTAQIMDVTGKVVTVFDLKNMGMTKEISLENYASGLYFVKINAVNGSLTKRIIKE